MKFCEFKDFDFYFGSLPKYVKNRVRDILNLYLLDIDHLCQCTEKYLKSINRMGPKCLSEIIAALKIHGRELKKEPPKKIKRRIIN